MVRLGIGISAATLAIFVVQIYLCRKRPLPAHGWLALMALAGSEWMMFRGVEPVATYFTPLAWTFYIFIVDAALFAVRGHSRLNRGPHNIGHMALLSIPSWLIFEAYNLRLRNWTYVGLPASLPARWFGYAWSFATITPALLLTAELVEEFPWFARESPPVQFSAVTKRTMILVGAVLLILPLVLPRRLAAYLYVLVWLGFVLLLDPLLEERGWPSLLGDLACGQRARLYSILISGWVCGWLWEFWNYWAAAKWVYVFPMFQHWKIFEMPAPGYLGFPPFALECFLLYVWGARWLDRLSDKRFSADDRVRIVDGHHWARRAEGSIITPPKSIASRARGWEGVRRKVKGRYALLSFYWVRFDRPQRDAEGDGPFLEGEIDSQYLEPVPRPLS